MRNSTLRIVLFSSVLYLAFAGVGVGQVPDPEVPPEGIPVESDWLYRRHYAQVEQVMKLPLADRAAGLETYLKKLDPKAKIHQFIPNFFGQIVQELKSSGQTAAADRLNEKVMTLFPHLRPTKAQEMQMAFQAKNYDKAIEFGETAYAAKPDGQIASVLAQSYIAKQNGPKAAEYSQKAIDALGPKEAVYYVTWMADYYSSKQDVPRALQYYDQLTRTFPNSVPAGWDASRWSAILGKGYLLRAGNQYVGEDFKGAIKSYYSSLEYIPKNEQAYVFIGLCHWKQQEMEEAMGAFALATVLDKPGSARARQYLEQIYKARNKDSLDGLDALLDKARSTMSGQ